MNHLSSEDLTEIKYFLATNQHRYRLIMELYNISPIELQIIIDEYLKKNSIKY